VRGIVEAQNLARVSCSGSMIHRDADFTAVGYGTSEKFPIPGQQTGPANPSGTDTSTFLIRFIADGLTYKRA
jgi:hypothetical protein